MINHSLGTGVRIGQGTLLDRINSRLNGLDEAAASVEAQKEKNSKLEATRLLDSFDSSLAMVAALDQSDGDTNRDGASVSVADSAKSESFVLNHGKSETTLLLYGSDGTEAKKDGIFTAFMVDHSEQTLWGFEYGDVKDVVDDPRSVATEDVKVSQIDLREGTLQSQTAMSPSDVSRSYFDGDDNVWIIRNTLSGLPG